LYVIIVNVAAEATVLGINILDMMKRANDIDIAFLIAFFEENKLLLLIIFISSFAIK
jgi:hypothetical protein